MNEFLKEHDACGIGTVCQMDGTPSHHVVDQALHIVEKLEHRAGKDASGTVGDGVGILLQVSDTFFTKACRQIDIDYVPNGRTGIGMFFFPQNELERNQAKKLFVTMARKEDCTFLGWRKVPVQEEILGEPAKECMPSIWQAFLKAPDTVKTRKDFDRLLYVLRREFEKSCPHTYVASLSCRTIVYKGMFLVDQLRRFYLDLQSEDYQSAIAIVHSRFSTNTKPSWKRAHPNRMIAHNGEINTIRGNANRMLAREESMTSPLIDTQYKKVLPVINPDGSDSAMLDNTLEFLTMNGMDLAKAVAICIPEPWKHVPMDPKRKDFYHYYATMMEPWDGPAAILFSDGEVCGAVLDRNGLRPARYYITKDGQFILSSEVGVLDIEPDQIVEKSRLMPGRMLLIDTKEGRLIPDEELKARYASSHPYGEWLSLKLMHLEDLKSRDRKPQMHEQKLRDELYRNFGYTYEDVNDQILPMAREAKEPIASMGTDVPLALLSKLHPTLFHYFKQLFAQVTNPPIDSLREKVVTDTTIYIGSSGNLLEEKAGNCALLEINHPILDASDMDKIRSLNQPGLKSRVISLLFYKGMPLKDALDQLFIECDRAYRDGCSILILSDQGVDESHMAIPSLLAVSALEQHLVATKKKTAMSILLESGEPKTVHEFAALLGFGASGIYPYLAHECIEELIDKDILDKEPSKAIEDYNQAVLSGIVKIAAKMGISTLQSYQGAQIFEAVGISKDVIDAYFTNTQYEIGGIGLKEIEEDLLWRHARAFDPLGLRANTSLDSIGFHKLRSGKGKEDHLYSPEAIVMLQSAVQTGDYDLFKAYSKRIHDENAPHNLRNLLCFEGSRPSIPLEDVEPVESIVKRFKTGAMSYGSISQEAHECMAEAMNRLGGRSNSGEGGERPERYGTLRNSAIKQVASGRFGVDSAYLCSASEIQIKMAQGAKPGEGGHLPGGKVYPWIAKTRCSTPGVTLISPPPHHDIYSIEDLAQLIFDLKNANRDARISVKLCSENGVGTVACGVAKAGAAVILISGYDGGTGAAGQSSIHHAGLPWELGLIQSHKELSANGLRQQVILETDGKLMSGIDVAIAALLGAEEFGFATAPLVSMGCRMMRVCSLDTCPFGIATQNEELRKRFKGKPEYVMNFMRFTAMELREIMAELGFATLDEMVGQAASCLKVRNTQALERAELAHLDDLLKGIEPIHHQSGQAFDFHLEQSLDVDVLLPALRKNLKRRKACEMDVDICSTNRTFGTILGSEMTRSLAKGETLDEDLITVRAHGGAGQSFGAFIPQGLRLECEGDANDYLGKGLSGGTLAIYPPKVSGFKPEENVIIGNVALYGATSGKAFINGKAGERFCVRNSGAVAVCEGCGDHGLEYMTGGTAVVLGPVGKNFAAGMSGGIAYVLDREHELYLHVNPELVDLEMLESKTDIEALEAILKDHVKATGSPLAASLLKDYRTKLDQFKKIVPRDYQKIRTDIKALEDLGYSEQEAALKAFEMAYPH
ncbi:glutamate synthase large subunit [Allobaculum fili]|uniref:glutamate synthase large subunit n=1 Tax=Allobaculum fili TaxID=2834460 RepID=UPI001E65697C|nr:glutamate synthase large subunit [Allobaculum fili]